MSFERAVSNWSFPGTVISKEFGVTNVNQHFACVINCVIWYKVRLFVEADDRFHNMDELNNDLTRYLGFSRKQSTSIIKGVHLANEYQCFSLDEAKKKVAELIQNLQRNPPVLPFTVILRDYDFENDIQSFGYSSSDPEYVMGKNITIKLLPNECKDNPEKYLRAGDHVIILRSAWLKNVYHHDGIYAGNKRVFHIYLPGGKNTNAGAHEDDWKTFLGDDPADIGIVHYFIRFRSNDQIIQAGIELCEQEYKKNQYHLISTNCQHFACFCATGFEYSRQTNPITEFIAAAPVAALTYPTLGS